MGYEKKFSLVFVVCALVGFLFSYFLSFKNPSKSLGKKTLEVVHEQSPQKKTTVNSPPSSLPTRSSQLNRVQSFSKSLKSFKKWLRDEEGHLNDDKFAFSKKVETLSEVANSISEPQADFLLETILSKTSTANSKILSTYLLTQASSLSVSYLLKLAVSPLPKNKMKEAHTLNETRYMQEKALRIMSIDALVERSKNRKEALSALRVARDKVLEPGLKSYIESKIKSLNN